MPSERSLRARRRRRPLPFSYESYQALIQSLGDADSLAATITLAALRLREEATASGDPRQFIVSEAQRLGVNTGGMNFDRFENSATQLLLVGVFQQEEAFLADFRRERAAMGLKFPPKSRNESSLRHALRSLNGGFALNRKRVGEDHFELLEYYRHLRNTFVHSEFDRARLASRYQEVSKFRSSIQKEYELKAPNEFSKLTRDDYLLATLITKSIAAEVCRLAPLESSKQLINLITHRAAGSDGTHKLFANKGDVPRFRKALSNWCRTKYKIDTANARIRLILGEVANWAIALPNKRTRGRQKQPKNIADWLRQQTTNACET